MFLRAFAILIAGLVPWVAAADTHLLMAEEDGCYWCAKWNEEISHIYPKTDVGRTAPLRRFDIHGAAPDVTFEKRVRFTPTFILVNGDREVGRIEGYPGEDFFWGLLEMLIKDAGIPLQQAS